MTSTDKIEDLLQRFGETLADLPYHFDKETYAYDDERRGQAHIYASEWTSKYAYSYELYLDFICHQSDVIEKLINALESAVKEIKWRDEYV